MNKCNHLQCERTACIGVSCPFHPENGIKYAPTLNIKKLIGEFSNQELLDELRRRFL